MDAETDVDVDVVDVEAKFDSSQAARDLDNSFAQIKQTAFIKAESSGYLRNGEGSPNKLEIVSQIVNKVLYRYS